VEDQPGGGGGSPGRGGPRNRKDGGEAENPAHRQEMIQRLSICKTFMGAEHRGMSRPNERSFTWLRTGREALAAMLVEIEGARKSIALEMYIWQEGDIGDRFRQALADAAARGVRVRVLVDAFGSLELPA